MTKVKVKVSPICPSNGLTEGVMLKLGAIVPVAVGVGVSEVVGVGPVGVTVGVRVGVYRGYCLNTSGRSPGMRVEVLVSGIWNIPRTAAAWILVDEDKIRNPSKITPRKAIASHFRIFPDFQVKT